MRSEKTRSQFPSPNTTCGLYSLPKFDCRIWGGCPKDGWGGRGLCLGAEKTQEIENKNKKNKSNQETCKLSQETRELSQQTCELSQETCELSQQTFKLSQETFGQSGLT